MFFVYVDWTQEIEPRPFYVGKGNKKRLKIISRNKRHINISGKYGFVRKIEFESESEQICKEKEINLILQYHTFVGDPHYSGIGCNFTTGGDGGRPKGWNHSDETKKKLRQINLGRISSEETKKRISISLKRKDWSPDTIEKRRQGMIRINQTSNIEKNKLRGKLSNVDCFVIHDKRSKGLTLQQIADEFKVTKQAIRSFLIRTQHLLHPQAEQLMQPSR